MHLASHVKKLLRGYREWIGTVALIQATSSPAIYSNALRLGLQVSQGMLVSINNNYGSLDFSPVKR